MKNINLLTSEKYYILSETKRVRWRSSRGQKEYLISIRYKNTYTRY